MINYISGDALNSPDTLLVHGCNNLGVMGSGIALLIKKRWPKAYLEYKDKELKLGDVIYVETDGKIIANAITQDGAGHDGKQYVKYDAIRECMKNINKFCIDNEIESVTMPKIGAGLGGGDWTVISKIIVEECTNVEVNIYVI